MKKSPVPGRGVVVRVPKLGRRNSDWYEKAGQWIVFRGRVQR